MTGPPTLRTDRLVLRPWQLDDVDFPLAYIDEDFARFLPIHLPYTRDDAERFVAMRILTDWDLNPGFAIGLDGRVIGDINVRVEAAHARAEAGWGIGKRDWGNGYTTEAASAVFAWAFEAFDLAKIEATADLENVASWRVMEKLGMTREGLLRSHRILRGERRDVVYYGVARAEFDGR